MVKDCRKASKILIRDFGEIENLQVSLKGPGNFVTASDIKVEKILIEELQKSRRNYSVLSEEIAEINNDESFKWIIDPIDGTSNFLHGIPHFSISIGLEHDKEIISGIIYDPIKDEMFTAEKGNGSYINNHRMRVSSRSKLKDCIIFTGGLKHESRDKESDLEEYKKYFSKKIDKIFFRIFFLDDKKLFGIFLDTYVEVKFHALSIYEVFRAIRARQTTLWSLERCWYNKNHFSI